MLAIDPGNAESAYVWLNRDLRPVEFGKVSNVDDMRQVMRMSAWDNTEVAIEMVASYGMAVGREVFETCVWVGRFMEMSDVPARLIYRRDVKLHHCGSAKAKDANIIQALIDRFAEGGPNKGKGTKANPGWFYGFRADIWQAYALAVYVADTLHEASS